MARKLIHVGSAVLACENEFCGFQRVAPLTRKLVDLPCPTCGTPLLTERQFEEAVRWRRRVDWINRWFGWLGSREPRGARVQMKFGGDRG